LSWNAVLSEASIACSFSSSKPRARRLSLLMPGAFDSEPVPTA